MTLSLRALLLCALVGHCCALHASAWPRAPHSYSRPTGARHGRVRAPRADGRESDAERRSRLGQLFGDRAAQELAPLSKAELAEQQVQEIQMLQEGMQSVTWGATRLVDVHQQNLPC